MADMKTYKLNDQITFGKYFKGLTAPLTIEEIIIHNPEYLSWCLDNVDDFDLDKEAKDAWEDAVVAWEDDDY